jgi:O-antigen/teichoic acid export membrane protein
MSLEIAARVAAAREISLGALPAYVRRVLFSAHSIAVLDQLVVSGASFATTVLVGRAAGAAELGAYAIAVSIFASVMSVQNALILQPFAIQMHRMNRVAQAHAGAAFALSGGLGLLAAGATALAAISLLLAHARTEMVPLALALAAVTPIFLVREFVRRFAFARLHVGAALGIDVAVSAIQVGGLGALALSGRLDAFSACLWLGFACGAPAIAWLAAAGRAFRYSRTVLTDTARESWTLGKWLLLGQVTVQIQSYGAYWLIMALGGAMITGVFVGCSSIVGIVNPLLFGIANVLTPKQALAWQTSGSAGLMREATRNALLLGGIAGIFCTVIAVGGDQLLHLMFRSADFTGYGHVATVLALGALATAVGMPASNALAAMERPRAIAVVGAIGSLVTILATASLMLRWGLIGAAYGGLAGSVVGALGRWLAFVAVARRAHAEAPVDDAVWCLARLDDSSAVDRLGEGDFATVYAVTPRDGGEAVVVKLYRPDSDPALARQQFEALARLHARLDGRDADGWTLRVPRPIAVSHSPPALTMTAVSGRPLEHASVPVETAASAGRAFARAMQPVWADGLLHGDLHLKNVLIDAAARTLALIDPGPGASCLACNETAVRAAARDLGHLVSELATDVSDLLGSAATRMQKQSFVTAALQNSQTCPVDEIRQSAALHLNTTLQPSLSPRGIWHGLIRRLAERRCEELLVREPVMFETEEKTACSFR